MANPEKLNTHELSPEEKVINESRKNIADFKDELPFTKEEAKEASDALLKLIEESQKAIEPIEKLSKRLGRSIKKAIESGTLKLSAEEVYRTEGLLEGIIVNSPKNLIEKDVESGEYNINPDALFDGINALNKQDRKLVKKIVKAIHKQHYEWAKRKAKGGDEYAKMTAKYIKEERKEINRRIN